MLEFPLVQALKSYDRHDRRRFHVPAHAGQCFYPADGFWQDPFRYDLTELDGLDVLSEPSGVLQASQEAMAELFGVGHSFMLINGASVGLTAAMLCLTPPGSKVLIPRNAHRAVLSGLILSGAIPAWFLPTALPDWELWGPVTIEQVKTQLRLHPDAQALVLTSPTYEGLGSDIEGIAELCQAAGVALVVDEAHGSLWPLHKALPPSACHQGADVVIHSLHKSGGSLTQSALAHLPYGSRISPDLYQQALNTLQSTSPSYLLMASLDGACGFLASREGQDRMAWLWQQVQTLQTDLQRELKAIRLFEPEPGLAACWDPCKLYLRHPWQSGEDWGASLEQRRQLAYESAKPGGVLYLANLGLREKDFETFYQAMSSEDKALEGLAPLTSPPKKSWTADCLPQMVLSPRDAFFAAGERVTARQAIHRVAKETIVHCPPGIPVLMPGERIVADHLPLLPKAGVWVVA